MKILTEQMQQIQSCLIIVTARKLLLLAKPVMEMDSIDALCGLNALFNFRSQFLKASHKIPHISCQQHFDLKSYDM